MFSSLDSVDIVVKPGPDGRQQFVQTDHRTPEEIEREPALSTLFALVRCLNPLRMREEGRPEPVVIYSTQSRPPAFLCRAIRAAGARLTVGSNLQPEPNEGDTPPLEEVVASAFADLAASVAAEYRVDFTPNGLETVENALSETAGDPDDDEIAYWSAVVKLGGFGGELIRASNGGRWQVADSGSLPFSLTTRFRGESATVNPLGKAVKRFANGDEDSLLPLVNLIRSQP